MNSTRVLLIMSNLMKWAKTATDHVIRTKLVLHTPKFVSNDLAKLQIHKDITNNVITETRNSNYLRSKFDELVTWYEQLSGMDEVRIAQKRVIEAQDRLISSQERRRESSKQLSAINNKLKEVYSDLDSTTRGEERYLQLITKEHKLLREEKKLQEEFNLCEHEERNSFTVLSSTVKDSHEKERAQAEKTKYWSLIGSIIGTVIGVVGSSINNEFKMRELRKMIKEAAANQIVSSNFDSETSRLLSKLEKHLTTITNSTQPLSSNNEQVHQLLDTLNNSTSSLKSEELEVFLQQQRYENKVVIVAVTLVGVIIPIVVSLVSR